MSDQPSSTRAQKLFLRAFRDNPAGPPPAAWPAPGTLRRWLRHEAFRKSLSTFRDTLRFQADFHITAAATAAAQSIHSAITPSSTDPAPDHPELAKQLKSLTDLLRLSHLRQRFTAAHTGKSKSESAHKSKPEQDRPRNPNWTDEPHVIANIFCDPRRNHSRLKSYMLLLTMRGYKGYEQFLAAFPEELANALKVAEEQKNKTTTFAAPPGQANDQG